MSEDKDIHEDREKRYIKQFLKACKENKIKAHTRDSENVPTIYPRSKKSPWSCKPWGKNKASLEVFSDSEIIHGKTINAIVRKFEKYIKEFDIIRGDNEATFIFSLDKLGKVARHFGLKQREFSEAQKAHQKKFGQMMKDKNSGA